MAAVAGRRIGVEITMYHSGDTIEDGRVVEMDEYQFSLAAFDEIFAAAG